DVQRLGHQADNIGLADRLGAVDRQGLILPRLIEEFLVDEDGAVDGFHRLQHPRVRHPLTPQRPYLATRAVVPETRCSCGPLGGAPPSTFFRSLTDCMCVRSMCSGVTEMRPSSIARRSVPSACSCGAPRKAIQ